MHPLMFEVLDEYGNEYVFAIDLDSPLGSKLGNTPIEVVREHLLKRVIAKLNISVNNLDVINGKSQQLKIVEVTMKNEVPKNDRYL